MKKLLRLLFWFHRWVGVALALFMSLWFFSGLVIMYSPTITQTRSEQLAHAETLSPEMGWLSVGEAWERSAEQRKAAAKPKATEGKAADDNPSIIDARLVRIAGAPLWLVEDSAGGRFALSALDGAVQKIASDQALQIAGNWFTAEYGIKPSQVAFLETLDKTILLRNQDALSPFHRISVGDDGGELLISSRTGEVLHASTRYARAFYWAGNWLHLLKPLEGVGLGHIRSDVQMWLGLSATLASLTGLVVGWLRWRPGFGGKPTYSQGRTQPYREFWFKWHFWSGLLGGGFAFLWALSGFLDTNPGKIFSQTTANRQEINLYLGKGLPQAMRDWQPVLPLDLAAAVEGGEVVELAWKRLGNDAVLLANTRDGHRLPQTAEGVQTRFDGSAVVAAVGRVDAQSAIASQTLLSDYDSYYYPRHDQNPIEKPLPVWLVSLADKAGTRFYVDPQDGKLLAKVDQSARVMRWAYSALHHWDFGWLKYRPLWDIWLLTWVSLGLVLGISSVVMAWKLLNKTLGLKKPKATSRKSRYPVQSTLEETGA